MAQRTTSEAVAEILLPGADWDRKSNLAPFIASASSLVDWIQANASTYGRTALSSTQAELVERWLSAHMLKQSDQQLQSSGAGRSSGSFRGVTGEGLSSTLYGRTALTMDTTRMLKALDEGRMASCAWTGLPLNEQTNYDDRN